MTHQIKKNVEDIKRQQQNFHQPPPPPPNSSTKSKNNPNNFDDYIDFEEVSTKK